MSVNQEIIDKTCSMTTDNCTRIIYVLPTFFISRTDFNHVINYQIHSTKTENEDIHMSKNDIIKNKIFNNFNPLQPSMILKFRVFDYSKIICNSTHISIFYHRQEPEAGGENSTYVNESFCNKFSRENIAIFFRQTSLRPQ